MDSDISKDRLLHPELWNLHPCGSCKTITTLRSPEGQGYFTVMVEQRAMRRVFLDAHLASWMLLYLKSLGIGKPMRRKDVVSSLWLQPL